MVGHTEFCYDGVCSESVLGDFPETIVGNCVLLQHGLSQLPVLRYSPELGDLSYHSTNINRCQCGVAFPAELISHGYPTSW